MELIRGSQDTLWGCQEEIGRWWRAEEEREHERDLTLLVEEVEAREEVEAMEALVGSEFVHQDTSVFSFNIHPWQL